MKKILATLLLGTALAVAALPVSAEGVDNAVTLTASGSTAAVHLDLPENEAKGVTALRLSFQVDSSDDVAAKFIFDDSLTASVQQYTYNEKTQILNVYLAGRSELLSQDGEADLGTIQLDGAEGSTATVTFVMDSLELVDASLGKTETTVISNGDVDLTVSTPSNPTPAPETTPAPESTPAPTQAPSGGNTSGNAGQSSSSGSQNSGSSQNDQSDENTATSTATSTDTPGVTAKPSAGQSTSGSKKPSSTSKATPTPEATATPDQDAQVQETTAPSESSTPAPAETATPEQSLSEQDSGSQLPVVPIAIAVVVVVAAIIGVAVIRFRG